MGRGGGDGNFYFHENSTLCFKNPSTLYKNLIRYGTLYRFSSCTPFLSNNTMFSIKFIPLPEDNSLQVISLSGSPRTENRLWKYDVIITFGISRVVKSLRGTSRFLAEDVAEHDLDRLVNKPVFWSSDGDGVTKNHVEEAGTWLSRNKFRILYDVTWWSLSSWLFLECWQLDISSKNIIISDTSLSLSHTCNNCIYLKQNYFLKYCFASWYSFWPAHDWIISAACFVSDWNWAIELWTWNSINIKRIYFAQLGT